MSALGDLLARGEAVGACRPFARVRADRILWRAAADRLVAGRLTLLDLWAEPGRVHMALSDEAAREAGVLSLDCPRPGFPSIGAVHPPAIRLERSAFDLYGLKPEGALDARPWLDHGRWTVGQPLGAATPPGRREAYAFLPSEGESLHQIPVGPVHAGIIEPGHFRFTAAGETVVRLEERLGYLHRGVEGRLAGAPVERAARLAGRVSGDSAAAYQLAFARAVEAAADVQPPPRAVWIRALIAELERLANHLGDIGAVCNDAAFAIAHARFGVLREMVLRANAAAFGHRLLMDRIVPGGVTVDLDAEGAAGLSRLVVAIKGPFAALVDLYDGTASLQDRMVGTGVLKPELARRFGAGGFVGRASGRPFDARRVFPYPPYDELELHIPVRHDGDVNARVRIRIGEVEQSLALIGRILERLPSGPVMTDLPQGPGEGIALVEGFRGEVMAWVRVAPDGRVERCRLRDPSWFQWPLLEACIEGNIVADFPLCNKSFNCAYAGVDL